MPGERFGDRRPHSSCSALIHAMIAHLAEQGVDRFCLDSGYKRAQKMWLRKFGAPYMVVQDYWGPGSDHLIWLRNVVDFVVG